MMRSDATAFLVLPLLAVLVVSGSSEPTALPPFPHEKTPADFPGCAHPPHDGPIPRPGSRRGPVWLVGIDGATWDLILPLVERGELPEFASLPADGARGVLPSEEPMISPAAWATIATGMPRFEHGVVDFLSRRPGSYAETEAGPLDRRSPAIWELVGAAGGSSAVISWFGSYPAEPIRRRLEALRTGDGEPVLESVIDHTPETAWRPGEAALTVRFSPEALLTSEVVDGDRRFDFSPVRLRHTDVSGAHRPEGVVLPHGPGIAPGRLETATNIYQIVPTLLYLLGLPQDERMLRYAPDPVGVIEAALDASVLLRDPPRAVPEYPGTDRAAMVRTGERSEDPARREALEKLRSLGYIR